MTDPSAVFSLAKLSIPITMVGSIVGGAAWLTSVKSDVVHLNKEVTELRMEFKDNKKRVYEKVSGQDQRLSRMEGKLDSIIQNLTMIQRKLNK